ncbi:putative caffeate O-methyltransferase [Dioscorea sansibarensis]
MLIKNEIFSFIFYTCRANMKHAVLDGSVPFVKAHGMTIYEHEDKDPHFSELFNEAMFSQTTMFMKGMLENYKGFESINVLCDVGGGLGSILSIILSKHPHIKAINFDLPHVVSKAKPIRGVEFVGGDMFESVPNGDAILMKEKLHNWSDTYCIEVLKNCWKALSNNGRIIVVEHVIPTTSQNANKLKSVCLLDVVMLACSIGGKERSEKEYLFLAKASGFSGLKVMCDIYGFSVMEFYK